LNLFGENIEYYVIHRKYGRDSWRLLVSLHLITLGGRNFRSFIYTYICVHYSIVCRHKR
jgi:hypothetical protein